MPEKKIKIILRGDGNNVVGYGHVYRLLALADMLKGEYEIVFVGSASGELLNKVINTYADEFIALPEYRHYVSPAIKKPEDEMPFDMAAYLTDGEIVVLDGYWFGTNYQKAVKETGAKLVCIDDFAVNYFYADAVINHSPGLSALQYKGEAYTRYYLGLDYALLRRDFFTPFKEQRQPDWLFVGLGGSDQYELTEKIAQAIVLSNSFKHIHMLVPSEFSPDVFMRIKQIVDAAGIKIQLHSKLSADAVVELMDRCTYALVTASTVLLECYSRGLICITGYATGNQMNIYNGFVSENIAYGIGDLNKFEPKAMGEVIAALISGGRVRKSKKPLQSQNNIRQIFEALC
ncbi:MAG TPA: hypothetical protein VK154_13455 [Chitinophagales bacterium]|nr:hypothetical protein [Chitinophagales bacterium]